jgi:hypothetical protein
MQIGGRCVSSLVITLSQFAESCQFVRRIMRRMFAQKYSQARIVRKGEKKESTEFAT